MLPHIQKNILLSEYSTIGLGGEADFFCECNSEEQIISAVKYSKENNLRTVVISCGSNIVFPDKGFDGMVLKISLKGIEFKEDENYVTARVGAGENWDEFVKRCIDKNLTGVECMSGIPGSVGATPIQNVGAYGQEVKDTISLVKAIDRDSFETVSFRNEECNFSYRESRFKSEDKDKFIISEVTFCFKKNKEPEIKYDELRRKVNDNFSFSDKTSLNEKLHAIRSSVIELRKSKSMVIDAGDPDSRSCGSFFKNPVLNEKEFEQFKSNARKNSFESFPVFRSGNEYKVPAAWLVENSGFRKGYVSNGVGISKNHSLALININGTTKELLLLAGKIETKVKEKFGIQLIKEPVII